MKQEIYFEKGAINTLAEVIRRLDSKRVFLVTGNFSYSSSGAEAVLKKLLLPYQVHRFVKLEQIPITREIERGLVHFRQGKFDTIIAVGGGSVIDTAKLIRIFAVQEVPPLDIISRQRYIQHQGVPLIALPTTAGSGSEATHFAVVYKDRIKHSVAHDYVLPDIAIIDPDLTASMPSRLTAVTGMDAFSQAVESYWSVNSTECSKAFAAEAIRLVLDNLEKTVREPSEESRYAMCKASHLAGRALNISKSTAPHALSYTMTSHFGIPHGHAVGLTLGEFFVFNSLVSNEDVIDSRGLDYVLRTIEELNMLLRVTNANDARALISKLMQRLGLETRLNELGISSEAERNLIIDNVNIERMINNLRRVTRSFIETLITSIQ